MSMSVDRTIYHLGGTSVGSGWMLLERAGRGVVVILILLPQAEIWVGQCQDPKSLFNLTSTVKLECNGGLPPTVLGKFRPKGLSCLAHIGKT